MRTRLITKRGGPIYVRSGGSTVTLVPETSIREWRFGGKDGPVFRVRSPRAVFVIDERGVRRLALRAGRERALLWLGLGFVVVLLLRRMVRFVAAARGKPVSSDTFSKPKNGKLAAHFWEQKMGSWRQ